MGFSTFSGPIRAGTVRDGATENTGLVMLTQVFDTGNLTNPTVIGNYDAQLGTCRPVRRSSTSSWIRLLRWPAAPR